MSFGFGVGGWLWAEFLGFSWLDFSVVWHRFCFGGGACSFSVFGCSWVFGFGGSLLISVFGWFVIASCIWVLDVGFCCVLDCLLFSLLCV